MVHGTGIADLVEFGLGMSIDRGRFQSGDIAHAGEKPGIAIADRFSFTENRGKVFFFPVGKYFITILSGFTFGYFYFLVFIKEFPVVPDMIGDPDKDGADFG